MVKLFLNPIEWRPTMARNSERLAEYFQAFEKISNPKKPEKSSILTTREERRIFEKTRTCGGRRYDEEPW
jgi:translation initiation factor 2 beta subunit (eIF-2beta)/eIF-5